MRIAITQGKTKRIYDEVQMRRYSRKNKYMGNIRGIWEAKEKSEKKNQREIKEIE